MRGWLLLALVVAGAMGVWWALGRIPEPQVWIGLVLGVWALGGALAYGGLRRRLFAYFIGAPYIWHTFYAWWYVAMQISLGATGSLVGAALALALGRKVEAAFRFGGI
jgi:hypothetical protein